MPLPRTRTSASRPSDPRCVMSSPGSPRASIARSTSAASPSQAEAHVHDVRRRPYRGIEARRVLARDHEPRVRALRRAPRRGPLGRAEAMMIRVGPILHHFDAERARARREVAGPAEAAHADRLLSRGARHGGAFTADAEALGNERGRGLRHPGGEDRDRLVGARQAGGVDAIGAGEHDRPGARQGGRRLAQRPVGQQVPVAQRPRRVEEHEVEVALERMVREAVVDDDHARPRCRAPRARRRPCVARRSPAPRGRGAPAARPRPCRLRAPGGRRGRPRCARGAPAPRAGGRATRCTGSSPFRRPRGCPR